MARKPKITDQEWAARKADVEARYRQRHGTKMDRIRRSYQRLQDGISVPKQRTKPEHVPICKVDGCTNPTSQMRMCSDHLLAEVRSEAKRRHKREADTARKTFYQMRRQARLAGDWELWHELKWRRFRGKLDLLNDTGPDARWRLKYKLEAEHARLVAETLKKAREKK